MGEMTDASRAVVRMKTCPHDLLKTITHLYLFPAQASLEERAGVLDASRPGACALILFWRHYDINFICILLIPGE